MTENRKKLSTVSSNSEINAFLNKARQSIPQKHTNRQRLIFAMDATASRASTWDQACKIQSQMFIETSQFGGIDIQLAYYRGYGEFHATSWCSCSEDLLNQMNTVACIGGATQIEKILRHTIQSTHINKVRALIFVGDCLEENADTLCNLAGQLGLLGTPIFIFQEGFDVLAKMAFQQMAKLSSGAYCHFDTASAQQLHNLLSAVAIYAAGGYSELEKFAHQKGGEILQLTQQIFKY